MNWMLRWNQALAFSPLLAGSRDAAAVFWPGCAALKLEPRLLRAAYETLQRQVPGLGFSSWCCGKPTFSAGDSRHQQRRRGQLQAYLQRGGIRSAYTLCPNCHTTLERTFGLRTVSAWPLLAAVAEERPPGNPALPRRCRLHDPCAARRDTAAHQAAREILTAAGIDWREMAHSREKALCCGRKNMLFLTRPAQAEQLLTRRLAEAEGEAIVTYCESCVEAFRAGGGNAYHLLEILLGAPSRRSFFHRVTSARERGVAHD